MKKIAFAVVAALAFANVALAADKETITRPPVLDFDRWHTDACYMSNCDNVPMALSAPAKLERVPSPQFTVMTPSYPSGQTCTSLTTQPDNALQTILTGTVETNTRGTLDVDFNGEPRIYRLNGSTVAGVGTVGLRLLIAGPGITAGVNDEVFFRWVLHENVNNTTITTVSNPSGVNQPIISTAAVRRILSGLSPNAVYTFTVQAKWSAQFTSLQLATQSFPGLTGGDPRGAMMCVPQLIVENLAP